MEAETPLESTPLPETSLNFEEPAQSSSQSTSSISKSQKWLLVAILILLLIFLGIGGLLIYEFYEFYQLEHQPEVSPLPLPSFLPTPTLTTSLPTPIPTPDKNPGWKTYRNEKYGFEFRYPPRGIIPDFEKDWENWKEGQCELTTREETRKDWFNPQKDIFEIVCGNYFTVCINTDFKSIDDYFNHNNLSQGYNLYNLYNIERVDIPGANEAVLIGNIRPEVWKGEGYPPLAYTLAIYYRNGRIYHIRVNQDIMFEGDCLLPETEGKKREILRSFRFFD